MHRGRVNSTPFVAFPDLVWYGKGCVRMACVPQLRLLHRGTSWPGESQHDLGRPCLKSLPKRTGTTSRRGRSTATSPYGSSTPSRRPTSSSRAETRRRTPFRSNCPGGTVRRGGSVRCGPPYPCDVGRLGGPLIGSGRGSGIGLAGRPPECSRVLRPRVHFLDSPARPSRSACRLQRTTGLGGYFGNRRSCFDDSHRGKREHRADTTSRRKHNPRRGS